MESTEEAHQHRVRLHLKLESLTTPLIDDLNRRLESFTGSESTQMDDAEKSRDRPQEPRESQTKLHVETSSPENTLAMEAALDTELQRTVPGSSTRASWYSRLLEDTWLPETTAIIFSVGCFFAIFGLLRVYDEKQRPDLPHGISFNALISILSTGSRSSLLLATAAIIGQGRWSWLSKKPRRLQDIQILDKSSRGPLGSLSMLLSKTVVSTNSMGAVIIMLALAFDPFFQQLVHYPLRPVPVLSNLASTKRALFISQRDGNSNFKLTSAGNTAIL